MELQIYKNEEFGSVRTFAIEGKPYFIGKDIAQILDYRNPRKAIIDHVDEEDKTNGVTIRDSIGREQNPICINESGLYSLILSSKMPNAKKFKRWVTSEVLPQIRQTGGYIPINSQDDEKTIMAKGYVVAMKTIEQKDNLIAQLEPKAKIYDKLLETKGYISLNKAAKGLKIGRNKMMKFLRSKRILFYDCTDTVPYQTYINSGYFTVDYHICPDGKLHAVTKVSSKGIDFIHKIYNKFATERTVA